MNKKDFLANLDGTSNHRILLWEALELTPGGKVVEFGSGHGSTPYLTEYCKDAAREFISYENNADWAAKTGSNLIHDWNKIPQQTCDVLLIDHAPGETRHEAIPKNKDAATIIVVHDTEFAADHGYNMRQHFNDFKSVVEMNVKEGGAGATMLSNFIDLGTLDGKQWDKYTIVPYEIR